MIYVTKRSDLMSWVTFFYYIKIKKCSRGTFLEGGDYMDLCVVCGSYIAEGSQVCKCCMTSLKTRRLEINFKKWRK